MRSIRGIALLSVAAVLVLAPVARAQIGDETVAVARSFLDRSSQPPLPFEEVPGDDGEAPRFVSRSPGHSLTLGPDGALLTLPSRAGAGERSLTMTFAGASPTPVMSGMEMLPGKIYRVTSSSLGLLAGNTSYRRVRYRGLYPGIDLVFYGNERELEFDFIVAPREDASRIRLSFSGADAMTLDANGELVFTLDGDEVRLRKPFIYQERHGRREPVAGGYRVVDARKNDVAFSIEDHDRTRPLVIDPSLAFATYRGGDGEDYAAAVEVNAIGETYLFGDTRDPSNLSPSSGQTETFPIASPQPGFTSCFLTKMSYDGASALYTVIFEGAGCQAMALAPGEAWQSPRVHLHVGTSFHYQRTLTEEPGGSLTLELLQGAYDACQLGSCGPVRWMRADSTGNVYFVMQYTPPSMTAPDFVYELRKVDDQGQLAGALELIAPPIYPDPSGNYVWDQMTDFAIDDSGRAYAVGIVFSPDLITPSANAFQAAKPAGPGCTDPAFGACSDAFLLVVDEDEDSGLLEIAYATYLGGVADDRAFGVAHDGSMGNVLITGTSSSGNFPTTPGSFFPLAPGAQPASSAFVLALDPEAFGAQQLVFGTFLSEGSASPTALTVLPGGMPAIVGGVSDRVCGPGTCFPLAGALYPPRYGDEFRPFLSVLSADGTSLPFSTFLDDSAGSNSFAADVANGGSARVYVAMTTDDGALGTANALQPFLQGPYDALVQAFDVSDIGPENAPPEITFTPSVLELTLMTPTMGADLPLLCGRLFDCELEEPDGELLTHLVWFGPNGFRASDAGLLPAPADRPGIVPIAFPSPGVGTHEFTLLARDESGGIGTATLTVEVSGENTFPGGSDPVVLTDARFVADSYRSLGSRYPIAVTFSDVTSPGLTWLESRSDLVPPPPAGLQAGSPPYYYDVQTSAAFTGDLRLCFDVRGMSFARPREELLIYRSVGAGAWLPLDNQDAPGGEQLCGHTSALGAFAIFYPQVPATAITTFAGTGCAEGSIDGFGGDPCDDFALQAPALDSTLTRPGSLAIDSGSAHYIYVTDNGSFLGSRIRRIDPASGLVSTAVPEGVCYGFGPIAVDPSTSSAVYCTAWDVAIGDQSIIRYDTITHVRTTVASSLIGSVHALAVDWQGNLFFADGRIHRVRADGLGGPELVLSTNSTPGFHQLPYFDKFVNLAFDGEGSLVAGGATLIRITPGADGLIDGSSDETVSKLGGVPYDLYPGEPFGGDGLPASQAVLQFTYQMVVAEDGAVVFTDQSQRIRRIAPGADGVVNGGPDEIVRTIAGYFTSTLPNPSDFATSEAGDFRGLAEDPLSPGYFIVASHAAHELQGFGLPEGDVPDTGADLSVSVSPSASTVDTGDDVTYLVTLENHGPGTATGVWLDMTVQAGFSIAWVDAPGDTCTFPILGLPGTLSCSVGAPILPGAQHVLTVHAAPGAPGTFTSTLTVGSASIDPSPSNNQASVSVNVTAANDLAISVVPSRTLLNAGDALSYAVTISNHGPLTATAVQFSMPAPVGFVIDQIELPPLSCIFLIGIGSVSCGIADLPSGASVPFAVNVHVTTGPAATATFSTSGAENDRAPANNTTTVVVDVNRPPIVDGGPDRDVVIDASPGGVSLALAGYSDPDGDAIQLVEWFEGSAKIASGSPAEASLTFGTHVIRVVVTDARFGQGSDDVAIHVLPGTLSPPGEVAVNVDPNAPGEAVVSWQPVPGALEYRIFRDADPVTASAGAPGFVLTTNAILAGTVAGTETSFVNTGLPPLVRQFYAVVAVAGAVASRPTPTGSAVIVPAPAKATIFGFADTHNHQFANLGFGRSVISGSAFSPLGYQDALDRCELAHGPFGSSDPVELVLSGSLTHDTLGFDPSSSSEFTGWPAFNTRTHQQSYHESVRRAFDGGQRLMVMHAENNELLCELTPHDPQFSCDDMASVEDQLLGAKFLEAFIDSQSGGPGKGWYRIAHSGAEARQIINSGRMAVVLGIEVDELFDCGRNDTCTLEDVRTRLDYYHALGVRHLFPVAHFDNGFGGAAMYDPVFGFGNFFTTGTFFAARACDAEGYRYTGSSGPEGVVWALLQQLLQFGSQVPVPPDPPFLADCNSRSLTALGEYLVREMVARGMIIDIDHMSALTASAVLTIAEGSSYPAVVSGHSGPIAAYAGQKANEGGKTTSQLARIRALGGLSAVFPSQGSRATAGAPNGVTQYSGAVANDCGSSSKTFAQAYIAAVDAVGGPSGAAVGIGTDFNGLGGQPGPRFGSRACPGDASAAPQIDPVGYPIAIAAPAGVDAGHLPMSTMPPRIDNGVSKPWDFNLDGLAHHGMLPDLIADMRRVGVSDAYLQPLFRSAEAYVSMWENAEASTVPVEIGSLLPAGGGDLFHRAADVGGDEQPVTLSFAGIDQAGYLVAQPMENPPPPPAGTIFMSPVFDISTTAAFTAPVTVCIEGAFETTDALVHFDSDASLWENITDAAQSSPASICGQTSSLSPFAVVRVVNQAPSADAGTYPPVEATSPLGASVTLSGSGVDPDGDVLGFLWTEGPLVLGDGATITTSFAIGAHGVTLTATDVHGASATSTTTVVVNDTTAPVVAPPPALRIPATASSGTSAASWPALAAWLGSATAIDIADPAPAGPTAQVNGAPVESATVFPMGTTTVTFTFRDASGNTGTAASSVEVSVGTPEIRVRLTGSGVLPNKDRFFDLTVTNEGTGVAKSTAMLVTALVVKGHGHSIVRTPMPLGVGDLTPSESRTVRVQIAVPSTVKELLLVEIGGFRNVNGAVSAFADLQLYKP